MLAQFESTLPLERAKALTALTAVRASAVAATTATIFIFMTILLGWPQVVAAATEQA